MKTLKQITFLFAAIIVFTLTGCEKDEENASSNNKMLIGTWDFTGVYRNGEDQTKTEDNFWATSVVEDEWNRMEFDERAYNIYIGLRSAHGGGWRASGNTLSFGNHSARIIKLTSDELIIEMKWEDFSEEEKLYEFRLQKTK
jgi:hypothetical protein